MQILHALESAFKKASVPENIHPMEKYMKFHFHYYGIKSPNRRAIFKEILKIHGLTPKENYKTEVLAMMHHPKREMNYSAIDLALSYQKKYSSPSDIAYISELLDTNAWWDTVDLIAVHLLGNHLEKYPEQIESTLDKFMTSDKMWRHRSCLLFQLKYKTKTDANLLFALCDYYKHEKEFFIRKAIGWALREYARTNPKAVYEYVDRNELSKLSSREATKHKGKK